MENRSNIVAKLLVVLVLSQTINLTLASRVFGYEIETHAGITQEAVKFYNQSFQKNKLSDEQGKLLIQGARHEDDDPRWFNHYYDPIHNTGLTAFPGDWLSSKEWAHSREYQISGLYNPILNTTSILYARLAAPQMLEESDFTWERALKDYIQGNKERGLIGLGHVLHLIEDASVPDHTRNDPHVALGGVGLFGQGSPYELWTQQFKENNIDLIDYLYGAKSYILNSLGDYFDGLANYSNKNFYSKDTIDDPEYAEPKVDYVADIAGHYYGFKKDAENGDYKLVFYKNYKSSLLNASNKEEILNDPDDNSIMRAYWTRLAPKSVQYTSGVIDLFFREVEKHKDDPLYTQKPAPSFLSQVYDGFQTLKHESIKTLGRVEVIPLEHENIKTLKQNVSRAVAKSLEIKDPEQLALASQANEIKAVNELIRADQVQVDSRRILPRSENQGGNDGSEMDSRLRGNDKQNATVSSAIVSKAEEVSADFAAPQCSYATQATPTHQDLLINEVAWMGSETSSNDEWIELKNISDHDLVLKNWQLIDKDDQIHVAFSNQILERGAFVLLERTNDASVPNTKADLIYTGALSNENEGLRLFNNNCVLVDEVLASPNWPAGGTNPKRSMERMGNLEWRTYSGGDNGGVFGTPKKENSMGSTGSDSTVPVATVALEVLRSPVATGTVPVATSHIFISEISAGTDASSEDEFVELYNPTNASVDLSGWALKKKSANSTSSPANLVSHSSFAGTILPKSFFLIAHQNYHGAKPADLIYSANSQNLAYSNNTVLLYDGSDAIIDEVLYADIPKNGSIERKAFVNNLCVNAENEGKFLGNACDTDSQTDFEIRNVRDPQNKDSLPEPRVQVSVSNFNINYTQATQSVALNWATTTDASGSSSITYILKDLSDGATTTELTRTPNLNFNKRIKEVARDYKFSIQAQDREGLVSATTETATTVPPILTKLDFYHDATTTKNYVDLSFDHYPFVPNYYSNNNSWKLVVFYKNSDPGEQSWLDVGHALRVDDITNVLQVGYYNSWTGNNNFYALALPDNGSKIGGVSSYAFEYAWIEDNRIRLTVPDAVSLNDYVTTAYYDYSLASFNDSFRLVATDKTKHYFASTSPDNLPPTIPGNLLVESYSTTTNEAIISFDKSTDPDGLDRYVNYQFNVNDGDWSNPRYRWVEGTEPNHALRLHIAISLLPGANYIIGVRAVDERGNVSEAGSVGYGTP